MYVVVWSAPAVQGFNLDSRTGESRLVDRRESGCEIAWPKWPNYVEIGRCLRPSSDRMLSKKSNGLQVTAAQSLVRGMFNAVQIDI